MKEMQKNMSSGPAYYEAELYNIVRNGPWCASGASRDNWRNSLTPSPHSKTNTFLASPKEGVAKKSRREQFFSCARLPLLDREITAGQRAALP
jgi:hypothetical protein